MHKPAVFLDRDGVINVDKGYVYRIEDFEWIDGAQEAIKFLNSKNYFVFVVTNQSGISRGFYDENDVKKLHVYINSELDKNNAYIDEFFYSPYHPDGIKKQYDRLSKLRKPETGMLELAASKWNIKKEKSFLIGDMPHDIECAKQFGIKGFMFDKSNLLKFVKKIIN